MLFEISHILSHLFFSSLLLLSFSTLIFLLNILINTIYIHILVELRRQSGVPEGLAASPLPHPELGLLGNRIRERGLTSFIMILHEPIGYSCSRKGTVWSTAPTIASTTSSTVPTSNLPVIVSKNTPFAPNQQNLFTIREEKVSNL